MLKEYTLSNFKAFSDEQAIPMRPITLVYGPNSSGKSSIIQSLLLLKQTLDSLENIDTVLLIKGPLVDLGGYREFINGHDVEKRFSFTVRFDSTDKRYFMLPEVVQRAIARLGSDEVAMNIQLHRDPKSAAVQLEQLVIFVGDSAEYLMSLGLSSASITHAEYLSIGPAVSSISGKDFLIEVEEINEKHLLWAALWDEVNDSLLPERKRSLIKRKNHLEMRLKRYDGIESDASGETSEYPYEKHLRRELSAVNKSLAKLDSYSFSNFLDELKSDSEKVYIQCRHFLPIALVRTEAYGHKIESEDSGSSSLNRLRLEGLSRLLLMIASQFQSALDQIIYIGPLRDYPERYYIFSGNLSEHVGKSGKMVPDVLFKQKSLLAQVNKQLDDFELGYELKISSVGEQASDLEDVFALRLYDKRTKVHASILDVGFGISQVLPIIVQSMLSKGKVLCIEQPEIHLHPRLQADLGTLFSKCIRSPNSNQFIIETHSQHLMLRLQKLIRMGELSADDVSVIYVQRSDEGAKCLQLRLDDEGDFIDSWPEGFFEEGYREMF